MVCASASMSMPLHTSGGAAVAAAQAGLVRRLSDSTAATAPTPVAVVLERGRFLPDEQVVETPEGGRIRLSPTESRLLAYLAARPGKVATHRALLDEVWGYASRVTSRTVFATVHRLRGKIERNPKAPRHVVAVSGAGYRFDP